MEAIKGVVGVVESWDGEGIKFECGAYHKIDSDFDITDLVGIGNVILIDSHGRWYTITRHN